MAPPNTGPANPPPETGRQRASRIPLDYYKKRNPLERTKLVLAILALLGSGLWLGYLFAQGDRGRMAYSRGPVASVHAAWDNKCEACHVNFSPMSKHNTLLPFLAPSNHKLSSDMKCEACHSGDVHHKAQKDESTPSCGQCHRDHRGRDASLVRLADSDCTSCHANLEQHMTGKPSYYGDGHDYGKANAIKGFASDHPDFALPKQDPGNIKFNHALHMTAGQAISADQAGKWTLRKLKETDPADYERYKSAPWQKDKTDGAAVVLDCRSCHVFDPGDGPGKTPNKAPARPSGAYAVPVNYENNCKACHPLSFDRTVTRTVKDAAGAEREVLVQVPHHLQPEAVDSFLWGAYADAYLKKNPALEREIAEALKNRSTRPLPGNLPAEAAKAADAVAEEVKKTRSFLFKDRLAEKERYVYLGKTSCGECHSYDDPVKPTRVLPANVPEVWQVHARFNHVAHRAMDCRSCHADAYAETADGRPNAQASKVNTDVLLPRIDNCRQCHAPEKAEVGGVRHDCTECHNYHHGANPLQGLGAAARDPAKKGDAKQLLQGKVPQ
jgi:hypothetical protein